MAFDYARIKADVADKLIKKFGAPVTLTKAGNTGGYDENGNVIPSTPNVTVTGDGVKLDYEQDEIDGTNIVAGDCYLLLGSASGVPLVGMTVPIGGVTWRVMKCSPLDPAGIVVMYTLQLRQG